MLQYETNQDIANLQENTLFEPLQLPCGVILKNRIIKSAMSDSLADGTGHPTPSQLALYKCWAANDVAVSIIGEVQASGCFAEKPGNLVLNKACDLARFRSLAQAGSQDGGHLWLQLGHAGALSYPPISTPKGPSALDIVGLQCGEFSKREIQKLPIEFAQTATLAQEAGFGGVEIHAAHGFLLSQFLSPLFNKRVDEYGGPISNRMRLLIEVIKAVRAAVGQAFPIAIKLNSSDMLEGGLEQVDALSLINALDQTDIDLIEISGGTYFPGAKSASDSNQSGPYFLGFAQRAKKITTKPLMITGGFKTYQQASKAIASGTADIVGLARALAIEPALLKLWQAGQRDGPTFPKFTDPPEGGITAWYTMRLSEIGDGCTSYQVDNIDQAIKAYEERDLERTNIWRAYFAKNS